MSDINNPNLKLVDWRPKCQMVAKRTQVSKPKYPVIDIHNHLRRLGHAERYLRAMDAAGVSHCVNLDAASRDDLYKEHLRVYGSATADRFLQFFRPDFTRIDEPDFGKREAGKLEEAAELGIRGLKIGKDLGLRVKEASGRLVAVDDSRLDPIWAKCGELGIPVVIHVSDPKAFFEPFNENNERYDELAGRPDWLFSDEEFPSKEAILEQRNRVFARHPETVFIGAHVATMPEELHTVGTWLDRYPNLYVDISARISELGRQPYTARRFLIEYQDRVMFGTDTPCDAAAYRVYYRFLETDDEYFDSSGGHHLQGRWMIYGVYLPDQVLEKIYNANARRILEMLKTGPSAI
jgi:predicted TIM-barrel fold metal-dependent hydrolase